MPAAIRYSGKSAVECIQSGDVTERYHGRDLGHMEVQFLIEDAGILIKPRKVHIVWDQPPQKDILENVCTENNTYTRHVAN